MKTFSFLWALAFAASVAQAQSESYEQLRDRFVREENVHAFSVNGFWCRMFIGLVADQEDVLRRALQDVKHVRLMTIPADLWRAQFTSTHHFTRQLAQDGFEELATIRDNGDRIHFHMRSDGRWNRYFVLVEEQDEVVVIELKGYLDPALLKETQITSHNR